MFQEQVVIIFAGVNGYMDDIEINEVEQYESSLMEYLDANKTDIMTNISETGKLEGDVENNLKNALEEFNSTFMKTKEMTTEK